MTERVKTLTSEAGTAVQLVPMPGNVVVEVLGSEERIGELGIIFAPQSMKIPRTTGRVVAVYEPFMVGDKDEEIESVLKVGDIVLFSQFSGTAVTMKRAKYVIMSEKEILCKVVDPSESDIQALQAGELE